ncbi:MAG: hypothetical protein ABFD82_07800 [Syntrophaceae bacterium]
MNTERLISRHPLNNGLTLEFWDYSRPIAGDRWFVLMDVRITIPIRSDTVPPELQGRADQIREVLGDEIIFSHKDERNFIAATEAPKILKDMQNRFLDMAPSYFGHPDFAARFIRGKFAEKQEQQRWQRLDTRQDDHS